MLRQARKPRPKRRRATHVKARSTKGWQKAAPKTREARRKLFERCGAEAFLKPNRANPGMSKFPIMAKSGACAVDCRALRIALTRAGQYRYPEVARKAERLGREVKCHWAPGGLGTVDWQELSRQELSGYGPRGGR